MKLFQQQLKVNKKRGFHLITNQVIQAAPEIKNITSGICQVFIQHTSASLTLNENADPAVRKDFETWFNQSVAEKNNSFEHNDEGADDMPAHIKTSLLGNSVMIPINNGRLALGTWQGIYFCEHRNHGGERDLLITIWGE